LGDSAGAIVMQRAFISGGGSVTYDSNYSAAFFVMMLPYAMMFASRKGLLRWLAIPAVPVLGLGMLKTGSRGGIVALVVLAVCIVIFSDRKSRPKQVLILSIGLAAMLLSPHSELAARLRALVTGEDYNFDAPGGRWEVWSNGMTMLLRRPVVGVGMYAYGIANHDMGGGYTDAHNAYVQIAAELGLPGIAALIVMIVTAFKSALGMRRVNLAILRADPQNERASFAVALSTAALFALIAELTAAAFLSLAYEAMTMFALAVPVGLALNERGVPSAIAAVARSGATRLRGMRPRGATPRMPPQRPPTPAPTS
jgi:O-antigen ligase